MGSVVYVGADTGTWQMFVCGTVSCGIHRGERRSASNDTSLEVALFAVHLLTRYSLLFH